MEVVMLSYCDVAVSMNFSGVVVPFVSIAKCLARGCFYCCMHFGCSQILTLELQRYFKPLLHLWLEYCNLSLALSFVKLLLQLSHLCGVAE